MTEKRRGRPPKAKPCPECGQTGSHYDDCAAGMGVPIPRAPGGKVVDSVQFYVDPFTTKLAQAYALRVWHGQSVSADRPWRIQRVKEALAGQNLPFDGVELPE